MNPYRSRREREAYEAGLAAARTERGPDGEEPKPLTMAEIRTMSQDEINEAWPQVVKGLIANKPEPDDE